MKDSFNTIYECVKCKGKFELKDIRYNTDKKIVCLNCLSNIKDNKSKKAEEVKEEIRPELKIVNKPYKTTVVADIPDITDGTDKIKLICADCRYNFSVKKGVRYKLVCPYCGSNRAVLNNNSADKLIKESILANL